jgi:hypothetical protein
VVTFDGAAGYAEAAGPLVDDSGSFTVSVTVQVDPAKLTDKAAGYRAQIVGQRSAADGKQSSWAIWYEQETSGESPTGRWKFGRTSEGTTGDVVASLDVRSAEGAALGETVQLTGVYDAPTGKVVLFVEDEVNTPDEQEDGTVATFTPLRSATGGPVAVGRGVRGGTWGDYLPGELSKLRVWAGAMTRSQIVDQALGVTAADEADQ